MNIPKTCAALFFASVVLGTLALGAYLAALMSEKPVTGTASPYQTLLLMRYAESDGGLVGEKATRIKHILKIIHVELERNCNYATACSQ